MKHDRNFENIFMGNVRVIVDPVINEIHDELEDAYYLHWKKGLDYDFYGYGRKETVEESKSQFDKLHGLLFRLHEIILHKKNMSMTEDEKTDPRAYNDILDMGGNKIGEKTSDSMDVLLKNPTEFKVLKAAIALKNKDFEKFMGGV